MPPKPKAAGKQKTSDDDSSPDAADGHDDYASVPEGRTLVKPENQLKLTDAELKEEFTRVLTANNPHAPQNIVRWNFKESQYKPLQNIDQLAIHFSMDGNMIHSESEDAKRQMALLGDEDVPSGTSSFVSSASHASQVKASKSDLDLDEEEGAEDEGETGSRENLEAEGKDADADASPSPSVESVVVKKSRRRGKEKKLTNQFNFSERASQTYDNPMRDRSTATEPPPRSTFSANVTQWEIFDSYQENFAKQEKNKEKKAPSGKKEDELRKKKSAPFGEMQGDNITDLIAPAVKILERMVNQNTYDDVSQDFKYYEDVSDEFREQEGSLLPLWRFSFEKVKKLATTCLSWSSKYMDLFAVGHGSYDFLKQGSGILLLYTLKNPSYPEYVLQMDSGIMSLDIHPDYPYLIAIGFYDGNVGIYNIVQNKDALAYKSSAKGGKHAEPVWEVRWQPEDLDGNLNFYSLSSDGRVVAWTLLKNNLLFHDIIQLTLDGLSSEGPDGTQLVTLGSGISFDFHPQKQHIFIVGTEEGRIHVCSKFYSTAFMDTYFAHHMAIYRIAWNKYHPKVFITCSADWSIKIWDRTTDSKEPMFTFDLGCSVGDVAWAPYSSTIFAAVTADGRVFVFDLNVNKYEPLCEQIVTSKRKTKLTHVVFNPKHPIIIVGDDRGTVLNLKLSPNLRKQPKEKKSVEPVKPEDKETIRREYEYQKLEKLLATVRQPDSKEKSVVKPPPVPASAKQDAKKAD